METRLALFDRICLEVDDHLRDIRARAESLDPPINALGALLAWPPGEPTLRDRIMNGVAQTIELDSLDPGGPKGSSPSQLDKATSFIVDLESELRIISDALDWSDDHPSYCWWLHRRQVQLKIEEFAILPISSSSTNFSIDTEGRLTNALGRLQRLGFLKGADDLVAATRFVRTLDLPAADGSEARWFPLSLGHELGHIRYSEDVLIKWLGGLKLSGRGRDTNDAIRTARKPEVRPLWFTQLLAWLSESACDSVIQALYDDDGLSTLAAWTSVVGAQGHSPTHPSPALRMRAQTATSSTDLATFKPSIGEDRNYMSAVNAYLGLALELRDWVLSECKPSASVSEDVLVEYRDTAVAALGADIASPPPFQSWDTGLVKDAPEAIESSLVRALWNGDPEHFLAMTAQRALIERALDSLQFGHFFEQSRSLAGPKHQSGGVDDVLWASSRGVFTEPPAADAVGRSSADIRLGRHFITFLRSRVRSLSGLDSEDLVRKTQNAVEIGWGDTFVLHPGEMVLGVTFEGFIVDSDCSMQVLSRSSMGRLGLLSATAVHVQPGYRGCLTLELVNLSSVPLDLIPGERIAQIVPITACGDSTAGYSGQYQGSWMRPQFSRAGNDWDAAVLRAITKRRIHEGA